MYAKSFFPQRPFFTLLTAKTFFSFGIGVVLDTWQHFRCTSTGFFYNLIHSVRHRRVLRLSYAFSAMVGISLLGATPPRVLASEYSQEYFRPGPDGNDRCAKHLTIIESDGRDGYSTVWRRHSLLLVTSGLHVMNIRLVCIFRRIPARSYTP